MAKKKTAPRKKEVRKLDIDEVTPEEALEGGKIPILILSNNVTPMKAMVMELLLQSVETGQLGYMDGKDPDTGEIVPLLVGIQPNKAGTKISIAPLARLFFQDTENPEDIKHYLVPDGRGGYMNEGEGTDGGIEFIRATVDEPGSDTSGPTIH